MEIVPEPQWHRLVLTLIREKGTVMVLGTTDSGKSTFCRFLVTELLIRGNSVSLVDADVGQSSLGLPGTVCMKTYRGARDLEKFRYGRMSYVGTANPAANMSAVIDATKRMTGLCRRKSQIVLVDTGGLVAGRIGRAFKLRKIRAVNPDHLIAVQRGREMEPILEATAEQIKVHRVLTSEMARIRNRTERAEYREGKLCGYFERKMVKVFSMSTKKVVLSYAGLPAETGDSFLPKGNVIGLNRGNDTAALGILSSASKDFVRFTSPIRSVYTIDKIIFGDIAIGTVHASNSGVIA